MSETPAEKVEPALTPAQKAEATKEAKAAEKSVEVAAQVAAEDAAERVKNPDQPVSRAANPAVGGESFDYGGKA